MKIKLTSPLETTEHEINSILTDTSGYGDSSSLYLPDLKHIIENKEALEEESKSFWESVKTEHKKTKKVVPMSFAKDYFDKISEEQGTEISFLIKWYSFTDLEKIYANSKLATKERKGSTSYISFVPHTSKVLNNKESWEQGRRLKQENDNHKQILETDLKDKVIFLKEEYERDSNITNRFSISNSGQEDWEDKGHYLGRQHKNGESIIKETFLLSSLSDVLSSGYSSGLYPEKLSTKIPQTINNKMEYIIWKKEWKKAHPINQNKFKELVDYEKLFVSAPSMLTKITEDINESVGNFKWHQEYSKKSLNTFIGNNGSFSGKKGENYKINKISYFLPQMIDEIDQNIKDQYLTSERMFDRNKNETLLFDLLGENKIMNLLLPNRGDKTVEAYLNWVYEVVHDLLKPQIMYGSSRTIPRRSVVQELSDAGFEERSESIRNLVIEKHRLSHSYTQNQEFNKRYSRNVASQDDLSEQVKSHPLYGVLPDKEITAMMSGIDIRQLESIVEEAKNKGDNSPETKKITDQLKIIIASSTDEESEKEKDKATKKAKTSTSHDDYNKEKLDEKLKKENEELKEQIKKMERLHKKEIEEEKKKRKDLENVFSPKMDISFRQKIEDLIKQGQVVLYEDHDLAFCKDDREIRQILKSAEITPRAQKFLQPEMEENKKRRPNIQTIKPEIK
jgi:hypothetical protein